MQRKNSILKTSAHSRDAMAMMVAIVVLIVIATIMVLSLALTMQTTKRTADIYLYEQSVLLSQSAAEYAMLKISQLPPCSLSSLSFGYGGTGSRVAGFAPDDIYSINITMKYISFSGSSCDTNTGSKYTSITHNASDASVLMDITIVANPKGTTEPIRYFNRSIQKL